MMNIQNYLRSTKDYPKEHFDNQLIMAREGLVYLATRIHTTKPEDCKELELRRDGISYELRLSFHSKRAPFVRSFSNPGELHHYLRCAIDCFLARECEVKE